MDIRNPVEAAVLVVVLLQVAQQLLITSHPHRRQVNTLCLHTTEDILHLHHHRCRHYDTQTRTATLVGNQRTSTRIFPL